MSLLRRIASLAGMLLLGGCATAPSPPVSVSGSPASVADLAGHWIGDYRLSDWSRHGIVMFDLPPGDTLAAGSVIMHPPSQAGAYGRGPHPGQPHPVNPEISVKFVQVDDGIVRGQLDAYIDPDCACPVLTVFVGRLRGDRIAGTFTVRNTVSGDTKTGEWSVERQPGGTGGAR